MNNKHILNIRDISDSREILEERPHRFVSFFVYILIAILAAVFIWAWVGEIDYYVRAQGEVRPNDRISTIRTSLTGRVTEFNLVEGKQVNRGDLLLAIDVESQLTTEEILARQYNSIQREINNLELFRKSIIQGENLFDVNNPNHVDYYFRYQKYLTDTAVAVEQIRNTNVDLERLRSDARISRQAAESSRNRMSEEIIALRLLRDSIDQGQNLVPGRFREQYEQFLDYSLNSERFDNLINQRAYAHTRAERLHSVGGVSLRERENAQRELDSVKLDHKKYENELHLSITQRIAGLERNLTDLNVTIQSATAILSNISGQGYSEELIKEKNKLDMLSHISDSLFSLQNTRDALQKDLLNIRLSISESRVVAPIEGFISLHSEVSVGDFIQGGTEIATIIPATGGDFKIVLMVSNDDIADVSVGQKVNLRFNAMPFSDYGELQGEITSISTDARNNNLGQSFFLAEAEIHDTVLYNRRNEPAHIRVGMAAEARVITETKKIICWVFEQLNFIN